MSMPRALTRRLRPGQVYRRADLQKWSHAIDRHLRLLVDTGKLTKLAPGLYCVTKKTAFGIAPPTDEVLVRAFLKGHRFLLISLNAYNSLGVGTTQLYNETVVYNHKRQGVIKLGGRSFAFRRKSHFPLKVTREFLFIDLINNVTSLAEDEQKVLRLLKEKARRLKPRKLRHAIENYGGSRAKKFFADLWKD